MKNSKQLLTLFVIVVLVLAGFFAGMLVGLKRGEVRGAAQTRAKLQPIIDMAFPQPPQVLNSAGGVIKDIFGSKINLEINDPDDYLPHPDGSPRKKLMRSVLVSAATKITLVDYTKRDKRGNNPLVAAYRLADLKAGDTVNVKTSENIRNAQEFIANAIELIRY
jgi:hypothetical protein